MSDYRTWVVNINDEEQKVYSFDEENGPGIIFRGKTIQQAFSRMLNGICGPTRRVRSITAIREGRVLVVTEPIAQEAKPVVDFDSHDVMGGS